LLNSISKDLTIPLLDALAVTPAARVTNSKIAANQDEHLLTKGLWQGYSARGRFEAYRVSNESAGLNAAPFFLVADRKMS
jgi:hypothetical protein